MSKGNKPLSWCWNYFNRKEERDVNGKQIVVGYCQFCKARYVTNAPKMEKHLEKCNKVGAEARKDVDRLLKKAAARRSRSASPKRPKLSEAMEVSSQSSSGTLKHYFDTTSKDEQDELDILLTRAFATGNISPRFLENPFFKQFITKLRPSYKLPSREYKYPKVLIPAEFHRVQKSLKEACNKADYLAISSDGWTDVRSNSIVNVVVHTPKPFLYDSIDATSTEVDGDIERTQHSGKFIAELLAEQIMKVGKHKIVAVVTDHAANMKNAWKKLAGEDIERDPLKKYNGETFPWILFEGCKAHAIDLAAKDICAKTTVSDCLKHCVEVAKFFRKKTPELIFSKAQREERGSSTILQLPVKTRWGTWANLASSIASNQTALKSAICAPGILNDPTLKREAEKLRKTLWDSEDFWLDVKDAKELLSPLAEAITRIEGNEVNSRKCYKIMREAFSKSKAVADASGFDDQVKKEILEILRSRQEFAKSEVAYLLDVLEPSDQGQSLANEEKQKAIELLANKCLKNPVFAGGEGQVMMEWASWLAGTGVFAKDKRRYAWDTVGSMDALTWWKAFFSDTLLSKIVQMLYSVPISAAPTERNWSLRGGIHTKLRNRMKVETASQVTFIKHNLMLEYAHLFKPARVEETEEENTEEFIEEINEISVHEDEFDVFMNDVD